MMKKKAVHIALLFAVLFCILHCFNVYSVFLNMNVHCLFTSKFTSLFTISTIKAFCTTFTVLIVSKQLDSHPLPQVKEHINRNCNWQQQAVKTHAACTRTALREVFIHGCRVKQSRQGYQRHKNSHCRQGEKHCGRK